MLAWLRALIAGPGFCSITALLKRHPCTMITHTQGSSAVRQCDGIRVLHLPPAFPALPCPLPCCPPPAPCSYSSAHAKRRHCCPSPGCAHL